MSAAHQYTLVAAGAAANFVFTLARLGVRVGFITAVGDDEFGTLLTEEIAAFGVDTSGIRRAAGQQTPVAFCSMDHRGESSFAFTAPRAGAPPWKR